MSPLEFLKAVLPDTGLYCATSTTETADGKRKTKNRFTRNIDHLANLVSSVPTGSNAYFACSTFGSMKNKYGKTARTQNNTSKIRSIWVDLDVGEKEGKYSTQADALVGLRTFCKELKLPKPIVINSGGGIHAYWPLSEDADFESWYPIASRFKQVALAKGLLIDPKCTSDSARVLRMPGTLNFKYSPPTQVVVLNSKNKPIGIYDLAHKLSVVDVEVETTPNRLPFEAPSYLRGTDEVTRNLMGGTGGEADFMRLYHSGECGQIVHIVDNQAEIPEPLWRAGLSVAHACDDGETAIHFMSDRHPEYSRQATIDKANATVGPMSCEKFAEEHPEICKQCKWWGKITSPIQLAHEELPLHKTNEPIKVIDVNEEGVNIEYEMPAYPDPYLRGSKGQVMERTEDGDVVIYPHPFYVIRRLYDPHEGEMLMTRLHLPHDGVREFAISLKEASALDKFRDIVSTNGVATFGKTLNKLQRYILRWAQDMQIDNRADIMRAQFGWTEDDTFVIGDREITANGIVYSPPARSNMSLSKHMSKKGSLEKWTEIANQYDAQGYEDRAFVLFAGFGAPLMKFTHLNGGQINMVSRDSGIGKTTLQYVINSIWGHPKELILTSDDTPNARIHRMGVMNSLPVNIDEVTSVSPEVLSSFLYATTQGRGKNRMEGSSNKERDNDTSWCTIAITSSNSSIEDKILSINTAAQGELMRLIEIPMVKLWVRPKAEADLLMNSMFSNYGLAGEVFMNYVVNNQATVIDLLDKVKQRLEKTAFTTPRERVWTAMASVAITAGLISKSLGLHDIDVSRVSNWARDFIRVNTEVINKEELSGMTDLDRLGEFLNEHQSNTLIIDGTATGSNAVVLHENTYQKLSIRIEPDNEVIYITTSALRDWCSRSRIPYKQFLSGLKESNIIVDTTGRKRLTAGTSLTSPAVRVVKIFSEDPTVLGFERKEFGDKPKLAVVK